MKKAYLFALAFALAFVSVPVYHASAHVTETEGTLTGVMHIDPSHTPPAGDTVLVEFFMSDSARAFDPASYAYTLTIADEEGATSTLAVSTDGTTLSSHYAFPHEGEYTATITGSSTKAGVPSFSFAYDDIMVLAPGVHKGEASTFIEHLGHHGAHFLLILVLLLAFLGVYIWQKVEDSRKKKSTGTAEEKS